MENTLTKAEQKKLQLITQDPVLWAKAFLRTMDTKTKQMAPWVARDYQVQVLRDNSLRKVLRMGRRLGKCIPGWTKIMDGVSGEILTVDELYKRGTANVVTMGHDYKFQKQAGCPVKDNGRKQVYRVLLTDGSYIDATSNHPLFTPTGWEEIRDLGPGDEVAVPKELPVFGTGKLPESLVKIMAMLTASKYHAFSYRFVFFKKKWADFLDKNLREWNYYMKAAEKCCNDFTITPLPEATEEQKAVMDAVLHDPGIFEVYTEKDVPKVIFTLEKKLVKLYLNTLFSFIGGIGTHNVSESSRPNYNIHIASEKLVLSIRHLLLRFGIRTSIPKQQHGRFGGYGLAINSIGNLKKLAKNIGFNTEIRDEEQLKEFSNYLRTKITPDKRAPLQLNAELREEIKERGLSIKTLHQLFEGAKRVVRPIDLNKALPVWEFKILAEYLELNDLPELLDGNIEFIKIKSITKMGIHQTYDLTVPETHNFLANDIVVHNTETMVIDGLHKAYTHKNFRSLYVTPYTYQIDLIFKRLKELIQDSPLVESEVEGMKSSPYYQISLKNGSAILGFTTGASTGREAAGVRGQRADALYCDELDIKLLT